MSEKKLDNEWITDIKFYEDLKCVIKKHDIDEEIGIPDFVLAYYIYTALKTIKLVKFKTETHAQEEGNRYKLTDDIDALQRIIAEKLDQLKDV